MIRVNLGVVCSYNTSFLLTRCFYGTNFDFCIIQRFQIKYIQVSLVGEISKIRRVDEVINSIPAYFGCNAQFVNVEFFR